GVDAHTRGVAARPTQGGYNPKLDRIKAGNEEDWNSRGRRKRRLCRHESPGRHNKLDLTADKISRQCRKLAVVSIGLMGFNRNVLVLEEAGFAQTFAKRSRDRTSDRGAAEKTDHRQRWLLRKRAQRPRDHCTAEKSDQLSPSHLITAHAERSSRELR